MGILEILAIMDGLSTLAAKITAEDRDASPEEVDAALGKADKALDGLAAAIERKRIRDAGA